uniref:C-type lectin domain-containing protein n=1 Tax=Sinocyclocheilus rhinocerous TaxID=307959 RepID=A0A673JX09_9TELE
MFGAAVCSSADCSHRAVCHTHSRETTAQIQNENLTNEREQLILKNTNLTNEREQLILKNTNLTNEREQLILKNTNLTNEREQLRNQLQICGKLTSTLKKLRWIQQTFLKPDGVGLMSVNGSKKLTAELLTAELVVFTDGWIYYQFSFYYMSNETRGWTESRRYCKESGADLIIINNREENDFVKKMFGGTSAYIGLTDSDVEARWKWVDGTNMTSGLWGPGEPNGYITENCGVVVDNDPRWPTLFGWHDVLCNRDLQWILTKNYYTKQNCHILFGQTHS